MHKLNWGIIGCGDVCEVKSGPAFQKVAHSSLVAVMRRDGALAADFARRHHVPKWYHNAQQLIDDPEVQAVYIATPPSSHLHYAVAALEKGKPVYIEKPMAHTAASARAISNKAAETGVPLSVAHYRRMQPLFKEVKALLQSGVLGKINKVALQFVAPAVAYNLSDPRVQWRLDPQVSGGGIFHDLAPHQLDLLFYFFGPPKKVLGMSLNTAGHYKVADTVSGLLEWETGLLAACNWFFAAPVGLAEDYCQITGANGWIRFPIFAPPALYMNIGGESTEKQFVPLQHVQQPMIEAVTQYFLGIGPNPCSAEDGVRVMECMEQIAGRND